MGVDAEARSSDNCCEVSQEFSTPPTFDRTDSPIVSTPSDDDSELFSPPLEFFSLSAWKAKTDEGGRCREISHVSLNGISSLILLLT